MAISEIKGVICCGNVVMDIAVWPVVDLDWNTTTWVDTISEGIGGNGANTSYALAKLQVPVRLISVLGDDDRGHRLTGILDAVGVNTRGVRRVADQPTSATSVLVHKDGDRKFLHRPGASRSLAGEDVLFDSSHEAGFTHFHMANPFAFPVLRHDIGAVMGRAKQAGLTTSLDTGWDSKGRWLMDLGPALPYTDILFANDAETRLLGGSDDLQQAVNTLHGKGVRHVVVKTGSGGCSICTPDIVVDVPGFVVDAIDSTGAGDCFVGGFLAGISHGMTLQESAAFANAVGALNVQQIGATTGLRSLDETLAWMRSAKRAS